VFGRVVDTDADLALAKVDEPRVFTLGITERVGELDGLLSERMLFLAEDAPAACQSVAPTVSAEVRNERHSLHLRSQLQLQVPAYIVDNLLDSLVHRFPHGIDVGETQSLPLLRAHPSE
jgi:hypothetical protein